MNRKGFRLALLLLMVILGCACSVWILASLARWRDTRGISSQLSTAVVQIKTGPQGVDGAEAFVAALKRINPGHAPEEVKLALSNYIMASERDLAELKSGHPTSQVHDNMARAQEKLVQAIQRNQ